MSYEDEIESLEREFRAAALVDEITRNQKLRSDFCNKFNELRRLGFDSATAASLTLTSLGFPSLSVQLTALILMITNMAVTKWCG